MGQFGNQPDFGTRAKTIVPEGTPAGGSTNLNSAALYIGLGGTLVCSVVGGNTSSTGNGCTVFQNIPNGTFFPVIVNRVYLSGEGSNTTCDNIVALY
jgi:hypothetical protein